jgi:hypothetical protein
LTPPEPGGRPGGHEYKPDYPDYQEEGESSALEVPQHPDDDVGEEGEPGGYYDSDDDAGSGTVKRLQLGCGAFIIIGLVLAIVVPVFGSFGGGDGGQTAGGAACDLFLETVEAASEGGLDTATSIKNLGEIAASAADAEPPIRDSSAALSAAANGLITATSEAEVIGLQGEIDTQFDNLGNACVDAGYLSRS